MCASRPSAPLRCAYGCRHGLEDQRPSAALAARRGHCQRQRRALLLLGRASRGGPSGDGRQELDDDQEDEDERPEILGDWRAFRAQLIQEEERLSPSEGVSVRDTEWYSEQNGLTSRVAVNNLALLREQNPRLATEEAWAHECPKPEKGGLVVAAGEIGAMNDVRFWQTVVFMVKHDEGGSWGLVLNRPTQYTMKDVVSFSEVADLFGDAVLYNGGPVNQQIVHVLHGHRLEGANEVVPGVFLGGLQSATEAVKRGQIKASELRFFAGWAEWQPGQLQNEIDRDNAWYTMACSRQLILKQCLALPTPLWREVLELAGGKYIKASRIQYPDDE